MNRVSIASDNGLSPIRRQAIIYTNTGSLLIGPSGTNFSENRIEIQTFSLTKMHLKISSAKWRTFRPERNESTHCLGTSSLCYININWVTTITLIEPNGSQLDVGDGVTVTIYRCLVADCRVILGFWGYREDQFMVRSWVKGPTQLVTWESLLYDKIPCFLTNINRNMGFTFTLF